MCDKITNEIAVNDGGVASNMVHRPKALVIVDQRVDVCDCGVMSSGYSKL